MENFQWNDELVKEFAYVYIEDEGKKLDRGISMLAEFKKSKSRKPLFTTEDGKEIYSHNETVWFVNGKWDMDSENASRYTSSTFLKYFSTRKAAEQYIVENKPCLSLNDIKPFSAGLSWLNKAELEATVKLKLNL